MGSGGHNKVPEEIVQRFPKLRAKGYSYKRIADIFGISETTVMTYCNPKMRERRLRESAERRRDTSRGQVYSEREAEAEWRKQLPNIPRPKTLNQILLGDPPHGRSALDKRQNA